MFAGIARTDITPDYPVWMAGMLRAHRSEGVHDRLAARALVLSSRRELDDAFALVTLDLCFVTEAVTAEVADAVAAKLGIPPDHVLLVASHTHSGPAVAGMNIPAGEPYLSELADRLIQVIAAASAALRPAAIGFGVGKENTISHYRRLLADDGRVIMNWESFPPERLVGPLGVIDPEVAVLKVTPAERPEETLCLLFSHAGHPNVMSGDNYLLSADYPGVAQATLDRETGGLAMYAAAALGTMDIDGLKDRDWAGVERAGGALAQAVMDTVRGIRPSTDVRIRGNSIRYSLPRRRVSPSEREWAAAVLEKTGGRIQPLADGVGDDYVARQLQEMDAKAGQPLEVRQTGLAIGDTGFVSFPGELYTEMGMQLKALSPFRHTVVLGTANGYVGYIPTAVAIAQGGYAEKTRIVDASAEELVMRQSLALLEEMFRS